MYVLFWNKGFFDEIYDAYLITPTIQLARWLWRTIDIRGIDHFIHFIATSSVNFSGWLWRKIDIRVIDRFVYFIANYSVYFARWLWQIVDIHWLERKVERFGEQVVTTGQILKKIESRTIQHQLLVMIFWLVAMTGLLYHLI